MLNRKLSTMNKRRRPGFHTVDFQLPTNIANMARITLRAPYPSPEGWNTNTRSTMLVYILSGSVIFMTNNGIKTLRIDDAIVVEAGISYRWVPSPEVTLLTCSIPPWNTEQQRLS